MLMTSAYANKLLKQLDEEKAYLLDKEESGALYVAAEGEEPSIPDYSFLDTEKKLEEINNKIQLIKHAVNYTNASTPVMVNGKEMTVDVILVRMAQLNRRKDTLDSMRRKRNKERLEMRAMRGSSSVPQYQYLNYDINEVEKEYQRLADEIMAMQLALDKHNQTFEFDVNI